MVGKTLRYTESGLMFERRWRERTPSLRVKKEKKRERGGRYRPHQIFLVVSEKGGKQQKKKSTFRVSALSWIKGLLAGSKQTS